MPYTVCVLASETSGEIYVGHTADLAVRLQQHNDPDYRLTLHTKRRPGPWRVVHAEPSETRQAAMRRERELKSAAGRRWIREVVLLAAKQ